MNFLKVWEKKKSTHTLAPVHNKQQRQSLTSMSVVFPSSALKPPASAATLPGMLLSSATAGLPSPFLTGSSSQMLCSARQCMWHGSRHLTQPKFVTPRHWLPGFLLHAKQTFFFKFHLILWSSTGCRGTLQAGKALVTSSMKIWKFGHIFLSAISPSWNLAMTKTLWTLTIRRWKKIGLHRFQIVLHHLLPLWTSLVSQLLWHDHTDLVMLALLMPAGSIPQSAVSW